MADVFRNVRLSPRVEVNFKGGPGFKTSIVEASSGDEQRNIQWSKQRGKWTIDYTDNHAVITELIAFFQVMRGRAYGFRFKDWSDYKVDCDFAVGDGTTTVFQAAKVYAAGTYTFARTLTRLVGPIAVTMDGVPAVSTVDLDRGTVTFATAPPEGIVLHLTGEFDVPVRFDIDELPINMITQDLSSLESVPIVEIRDR